VTMVFVFLGAVVFIGVAWLVVVCVALWRAR
jgi:hypothetical protein